MSIYDTTSSLTITNDQRPGVIALSIISTISTTCVALLLLNLFVIAFISSRARNHEERVFLRTHIGALVVCLLLSDLIQGISGMITLVWATDGRVTTGPFCTAQAVMLHLGDVGTAFWNTAIAGHTFWTVVLGKQTTTLGISSVIASGWALSFILTIIGPLAIQTQEKGSYYGLAGAWCFTTSNYKITRIILHYLPMLLSACIITILYVHVALVLFGVLTVNGGTWRLKAPTRRTTIRDFFGQFSWGRLQRPFAPAADQPSDIKEQIEAGSADMSDGSVDRGRRNKSKSITKASSYPQISYETSSRPTELKKLGMKMLWYPSVYLILILPMAITRISPTIDISLDVVLGFTCFLLFMGTANTIIYLCTRRLGPTPWSRRRASISVSRSRAERGQAGTPTNGDISMQIQIQSYTQPATEEQSIDMGRKISTMSGVTEASSISLIPHVVGVDSGEDLMQEHRESKVGFGTTDEKVIPHVLPLNSPSSPITIEGAYAHIVPYLGLQQPYSPHTLSPSSPQVPPQEQDHPQDQTHPGHHPYSFA